MFFSLFHTHYGDVDIVNLSKLHPTLTNQTSAFNNSSNMMMMMMMTTEVYQTNNQTKNQTKQNKNEKGPTIPMTWIHFTSILILCISPFIRHAACIHRIGMVCWRDNIIIMVLCVFLFARYYSILRVLFCCCFSSLLFRSCSPETILVWK